MSIYTGLLAAPARGESQAKCMGAAVTIVGTPGDDTITGTFKADVIRTFAGDDVISGLAGEDRVCANRGNDTINGGGASDLLFGGRGRDAIAGDANYDTINGGRSVDSCEDTYFNTYYECEIGAGGDPDKDDLVNAGEADWGTDPNDADTDGDGIKDGHEIPMEAYPNDACSPNLEFAGCDRDADGFDHEEETTLGSDVMDACDPDPTSSNCDLDGDQLGYDTEVSHGTDPENSDSDGDGYDDGWEIAVEYDPLDPCDPDSWACTPE